MNSVTVPLLLISAFMGAIMLLLPHISPRRYLFAITVPPGFAASPAGRASLRRYHWIVAAAILAAVPAALTTTLHPAAQFYLLLPVAAGFASFLRERGVIRRLAPSAGAGIREASLAPEGDHLPRWFAAAIVPFAFPVAAAEYLSAHWDEIPARFPIHWDLNGVANGWADKTLRGVYGSLLFGCGMMLLMLVLALGMFYGSRRAPIRKPMLAILVAVVYLLGFVFSATGLMPLVHVPMAVFLLPSLVLPVAIVIWALYAVQKMPSEATPDECWKLGAIYYNPSDPALFVQKRIGFGYTFNFGNRMAWLLMGGFAAGMVGLIFLLPKS
jgi:uncharacterized membrane protein